jgi:5-methylcytosine-specific restriction protein A
MKPTPVGRTDMGGLKNRQWRAWYNDPRHRRRRDHQLKAQPLCQDCLAQGKTVPAVIAHHTEPHGGDISKFLTGPLRSLCEQCHNRINTRGFSTAIGIDGRPLDPKHPANAERERDRDLPPLVDDGRSWPTDLLGSKHEPRAPKVEAEGSLPQHLREMLERQKRWKPRPK